MNRKQREKNKITYRNLMYKLQKENPSKYLPMCQNCGEYGSHFIPPCFGDVGYYYCAPIMTIKE